MNDEFYKNKIEFLLKKHGQVSVALLQLKLKLSFQEAFRIYQLYVSQKKVINNFPEKKSLKTLIKKHSCHSVSVPYLQKQLNLTFEETEKLLEEWKNLKKESDVYKNKFTEISKYLKPPKFKKPMESLSELQRKKENRIINAIRFLESIGYTVEKK